MTASLAISIGQYSTAGAKPENQDFHGAMQPEGADLSEKGIAICLADGISTSSLGATAAETAVKSFLTDYFCTSPAWSVRTSGERVITATNSWMHSQNRRAQGHPQSEGEREKGMICTLSALVLKGRTGHIFHVGDGRICRLGARDAEPLTEDHRVDLGGGETYLGRALGVNRHVEIDYSQFALNVGDLFMLSSDGVHETLPDHEIAAIVGRAFSLDEAAQAVAKAAFDAGSNDNLTVQLVRVDGLPDGGIEDILGHDTGLPPAPILSEGQAFEGYHILSVLHSGSRSHVYLAQDDQSGDVVALKALSTELGHEPAAQAALMLEDWAMRRLNHPNLLAAAEHGRERNYAYSVSEFVGGQSLHAWMLEHRVPELSQVRDIVKQLAAGLHALHRKEMVHRDLRPQNVLVEANGRLKIIDFGSVQVAGLDDLAEQALEGAYAGTMQYSAPELYLGHLATARSDLFSLGVIAYQMLTGQLPYGPQVANARTLAAQRQLTYTPVTHFNPDVPDWMDAAIRKAVNVDPAKRYDELSEFVVDLAKPNRELATSRPVPLLDRGSIRLWQLLCAILAGALVLSMITRPDAPDPSIPEKQETLP